MRARLGEELDIKRGGKDIKLLWGENKVWVLGLWPWCRLGGWTSAIDGIPMAMKVFTDHNASVMNHGFTAISGYRLNKKFLNDYYILGHPSAGATIYRLIIKCLRGLL